MILMANGAEKPIEEITTSDWIMATDAQGNLVPGKVDKLFTNTTQDFIRLSLPDRDDLITTPGHRFQTETGDYMEIGHMLRLGGGTARVVDLDGSIVEARGVLIAYSAETADLFEQAQLKTIASAGNTVLKEQVEAGWKTYNFEVQQHHNYVAGGIRVHNDSILSLVEPGDELIALSSDLRDMVVKQENPNGSIDYVIYDGFAGAGGNTALRGTTTTFTLSAALVALGTAEAIDAAIAADPNAVINVGIILGILSGFGLDGDEEVFGDGVTTGTNSSEVISGTSGSDYIDAMGGNDDIRGLGGDDLLYGGDGNDQVRGDGGNDFLVGGDGGDLLNGGSGRDSIVAGDGDDTIYGGAGNDEISAFNGLDLVYGGSGHDNIGGGADADSIRGDSGNDTIGSGGGNDTIEGGSGSDYLSAGAGNDRIYGNEDNDTLVGSTGNDSMWGGSGNDEFRFTTLSSGETDRIYDFQVNGDHIDLRGTGLTSIADFDQFYTTNIGGVQTVVIREDGHKILLSGLTTSDLDNGDFMF